MFSPKVLTDLSGILVLSEIHFTQGCLPSVQALKNWTDWYIYRARPGTYMFLFGTFTERRLRNQILRLSKCNRNSNTQVWGERGGWSPATCFVSFQPGIVVSLHIYDRCRIHDSV